MKHLCLFGLSLLWVLFATGSLSAQENADQLRLLIHRIDDQAYPSVQVFFVVHDLSTGEALWGISPNALHIALDNAPDTTLPIEQVLDTHGTTQAVQLILAFDTTASDLAAQQTLGHALLDRLTANDWVGLLAMTTNGSQVLHPLSRDHGAAHNALDLLASTGGSGLQLDETLQQAVDMFKGVDSMDTNSALVLVATAGQVGQTATANEMIVNAVTEVGASIFGVGFSPAARDALRTYAAASGGFVYAPETYDDDPSALATSVVDAIKRKQIAVFQATLPTTGQAVPFTLNMTLADDTTASAWGQFTARPRAIAIHFPEQLSDFFAYGTMQTEPIVVYRDNAETPELATVDFWLQAVNSDAVSPLRPAGNSERVMVWQANEYPQGEYRLLVEVEDIVGNRAEGNTTIAIIEPPQVQILTPAVNSGAELAHVLTGTVEVQIEVESIAPLLEVRLLVDDVPIGDSLTTPPYHFQWQTGSILASGRRTLRVEVEGNVGQVTAALLVVWVEPGTNETSLFLGLLVFVTLGTIAVTIWGIKAQRRV